MTLFSVQIPYQSLLFEGNGFSLVNDNNFYSLHFILLVISTYLLYQNQIKKTTFIAVNFLSVINIVASSSRRGYVLYCIVFILLIIIAIHKKCKCSKTIIYNCFGLIFTILISSASFFLTNIFYTPETSYLNKEKYHRLFSIIDNSISFQEFDINLQKIYSNRVFGDNDNDNLFFNGNLEHGITNWGSANAPQLNIVSTIKIDNENGYNYLRTERISGDGYFQVIYYGRPIYYHKGITYNLSFKYRTAENEKAQFDIGWWTYDNNNWLNQLPKKIIYDTCN